MDFAMSARVSVAVSVLGVPELLVFRPGFFQSWSVMPDSPSSNAVLLDFASTDNRAGRIIQHKETATWRVRVLKNINGLTMRRIWQKRRVDLPIGD